MKSTHDLDMSQRPVVALADEYPAGFVDSAHSHERIQILYACSGVMSVVTDKTSFVIPPQRAVWIPSQVVHEVSCRGPVSLRTLYIDPKYERDDPDCHIVEVGPLLRALILEVTTFDLDYDVSGREGQIVDLLISELLATSKVPYAAPMPSDPRLVRVCREIIENPSDQRDIDNWADLAGMSRRSFTRAVGDIDLRVGAGGGKTCTGCHRQEKGKRTHGRVLLYLGCQSTLAPTDTH